MTDPVHKTTILHQTPLHLIGIRLDKAVAEIAEISRTKAAEAIRAGNILVNGIVNCDLKYKMYEGDQVEIIPKIAVMQDIKPADIPVEIIYEDEDIAVINKQAGLTVHPGAGNHQNTLVNALFHLYGDNLSSIGGDERLGIVHRLDKDTSGLMIIAKNDKSHAKLSNELAERNIKRTYIALVWGNMNPSHGTVETNIARSPRDRTRMTVVEFPSGKHAITHYKVLKSFGYISMVECQLETGRTHQIRVHMSHIGHSVVGDQTYGHNARKINNYYNGPKIEGLLQFKRQALHATKMEFEHPTGGKMMSFEAEMPEDMMQLISLLTK